MTRYAALRKRATRAVGRDVEWHAPSETSGIEAPSIELAIDRLQAAPMPWFRADGLV